MLSNLAKMRGKDFASLKPEPCLIDDHLGMLFDLSLAPTVGNDLQHRNQRGRRCEQYFLAACKLQKLYIMLQSWS